MCQMPNIWHICHTKQKMVLYEMCQISKIIQHGYSTVANLQRYRQMLQKFYYFIFSFLSPLSSFFSFLFSLTLRFPLSSPCTGSLSLWPVRDVHRQQRRHSSDDDSALRHAWSHPRLAMLDLADLTLRPPSIPPSSLSSLSAFHWLWVFFFFFGCNFGWSDGGGGL